MMWERKMVVWEVFELEGECLGSLFCLNLFLASI
jgi:hypothetical protein